MFYNNLDNLFDQQFLYLRDKLLRFRYFIVLHLITFD